MSKRRLLLSLCMFPVLACAGNPTEPEPQTQASEDELSLQNLYRLWKGTIDRTVVDPHNPWAQTELGIGEENRLEGEAEEFAGYARLVNEMQSQARTQDGDENAARTFHKKPHACTLGTLTVDNRELPAAARIGIFADNRSYPTWTRLSNGVGNRQADRKVDVRGLALKIMGVAGARMITTPNDETATTQDFLMANQSVAPGSDVRGLMGFAAATTSSPDSTGILGRIASLTSVGRFLTRDENVRIVDFLVNRAVPKAKEVGSLLGDSFFTGVPNALGLEEGNIDTARAKGAFKLMAKTGVLRGATCEPVLLDPGSGDDYLRADFERRFASQSVCIDLFVQFQQDPARQSIEDGSVEWNTPFTRFGRVAFEPKRLDSNEAEAEQAACESFAFWPWHTLAEHRPLGNMMRARRVVMPSSQAFRGADTTEPTADAR